MRASSSSTVLGELPRPARLCHISRLFHSTKARKQTRICACTRSSRWCQIGRRLRWSFWMRKAASAYLAFHNGRVDTLLRTSQARSQALERFFDPLTELVVHGPLLAAPIGGTAQDHGLLGLGVAREFDLDAFVDRAPSVRAGEFKGELLQFRLRRSDDIAPAGLAQPRQIAGAGHAAIGDPDPPQHAMPGLHGGYDRLQGSRVVGVAGENLVAQGKAVEGHYQRDTHLLAVGTMIARIAALRLRIGRGVALKIRARHVIEQHLVLDRKQLSAALRQMRFQLGLIGEQMIEPAVEPILVDLLVAEWAQV